MEIYIKIKFINLKINIKIYTRVIATILYSYRDPVKLDIVFTLYSGQSKPRHEVKK